MPIFVCEYCGKPCNNRAVKLCPECSKLIEEAYFKARRYIYQNPKTSDFISIVEATQISEKALNYLIDKGRIEIANRAGGGGRCRACGKETGGGSICAKCLAKLASEKLISKSEAGDSRPGGAPAARQPGDERGRKNVIPISYSTEDK